MREYAGIAYRSCPEPTTRSMLGVIDYYLHDLSKGMHRISVGEIPDGSGDPISDAKLSDLYLVLLGRPGNQVAHGGTSQGGTLTLASTTNATKGFVYLGNAKQSAYDETNERLGINEPVPEALLHLRHTSGGVVQNSPPAGNVQNGWGVYPGGSSVITVLQTNDGDSSVINGPETDTSIGVEFEMVKPADPGIYTGWRLHIICRKFAATLVMNGKLECYYNRTYSGGVFSGGGYVGGGGDPLSVANYFRGTPAFNTPGLNISETYQDLYWDLTATQAGYVAGCTNWTVKFTSTGSGTAGNYVKITQVYLECPGILNATPLQKWENTTLSNELNYVADAFASTTLQFSGTPKFRITSGLELDIGTPVAGYLWSATDTEGTGAWQSLLALGVAPNDAKYIVQEATTALSAEQSLGLLTTGALFNTVTAGVGVLSIEADLTEIAALNNVAGDLLLSNATANWSLLALSAPAANVRNVLGVDNTETVPSWKTALDGTAPTTITAGASSAAGTSLVFSHRDHTHGAPATWAATAHHLLDGSVHDDTLAHTPVVAGDLIYGNATPKWAALAADTSNTRKFLRTLSVAGTGQAPAWDALQAADIPDLSTGYVTINTVQTITAPKTISVGADLVPLTLKAASGTPSLLTCLLGAATKFTVGYSGAIEYMGDYITFGNALTLISGGSAFPQTVEIPGSIGSGVLAVRGAGPDPAASTGDIAQVNRVGASAIGTSSGGILGPLKLTFGAPAGFYMIHGSLEVVTAIASRSLTVTLAWTGAQAQTGRVILGPMHMDAGEISTCGMAIYSGTGDISWSTTVSGGANLSTGRANLRFRVTYLGA